VSRHIWKKKPWPSALCFILHRFVNGGLNYEKAQVFETSECADNTFLTNEISQGLMKQLAHHVMGLPFMRGSKFKQNQER
jgi:hypothetical protein